MQGPLEQTVAKRSWIFLQIGISNELNKITLKCKDGQAAVIPTKIQLFDQPCILKLLYEPTSVWKQLCV